MVIWHCFKVKPRSSQGQMCKMYESLIIAYLVWLPMMRWLVSVSRQIYV